MAIKNFNRVVAKLKRVEKAVLGGSEKAMRMEMELVITTAKTRCPVDFGTLRSSGRAQTEKKTMTKVIVEGAFGDGPSGKYALYVHEGVGTKSGRSGGTNINYKVGQPKFLESAFKERESRLFYKVGEGVARTIQERLGK